MEREEIGEPRKRVRAATVLAAVTWIAFAVLLLVFYQAVFAWALAVPLLLLVLWLFASETGQMVSVGLGALGAAITLPIVAFLAALDSFGLLMGIAGTALVISLGLFLLGLAGMPKR